MAGYPDLVARAQPRLLDFQFAATEGTDWKFTLTGFVDGAGDDIDLSGATFECKVLTDLLDDGGAVVATWTVTGGATGTLTGTLADATTAGLAAGASRFQPRQCIWYCFGTLSGNKVQFWGPTNSTFSIAGS